LGHILAFFANFEAERAQNGPKNEKSLFSNVNQNKLVFSNSGFRSKNRLLKSFHPKMQDQMDVLELRVAAECKEAFAELQTEITEIGCEVQSAGKAICSKEYCLPALAFHC
jgi:hypothetical protein